MRRRYAAFGALAIIAIAGALILRERYRQKDPAGALESTHSSGAFEYAGAIRRALSAPSQPQASGDIVAGITSHHLPIALDFIADFYIRLSASMRSPKIFIVIGPDHFERCMRPVSTTRLGYDTPFGRLDPDKESIDSLVLSGVSLQDDCFENEHSIGVQAAFIKAVFPQARIVPVILSASTPLSSIDSLAASLAAVKDESVLLVSTDFSHYQSIEKARTLDEESRWMIASKDAESIDLLHVDSPASIKVAVRYARFASASGTEVFGQKNSYDFTGQAENTTGYLNVFFHKSD